MNKSLFVVYTSNLLIFLFSSGIPIYIFVKTRLMKELCALISIGLSIGLINLYFFIGSKMHLASNTSLNEFHEVLWIITPTIVYLCCIYIQRRLPMKR
jgi:hypothetical protein